MEVLYCIDQCQSFLFQLCVVSLCRVQRPKCKTYWSLTAVWVDMRDHSTYPICRGIRCQLDREICVVVGYNLGREEGLLECFLTFLRPIPVSILSEESVEGVHHRCQVGDKLRIIVQQSQKRSQLLLTLWCRCLNDSIYLAR